MIEGVSVGVGSTGKGYNSGNYDYTLFEILETDPNIGGTLGTVRYNLSNIIDEGEIPGTFQSTLSSPKIIAENEFPIFDIKLKIDEFEKGEDVVSGSKRGTVQSWNNLYGYLRVSSTQDFIVGEIITGQTTENKGVVISYTSDANNLVYFP